MLLLFLAASFWITGEAQPRLAVIRSAPDIALVDQDGKAFKLSDLRGKTLLVSFIFTTCNGTCPATTHRLAKVRQLLAKQTTDVALVSITLDPQRDTPEALRKYMKLWDIEPGSWSFLTGPPDAVNKVVAAWGMWAKPLDNGQLDHPSRIFLVDGRQRIREIYNTELLRPDDVCADVLELVRDKR